MHFAQQISLRWWEGRGRTRALRSKPLSHFRQPTTDGVREARLRKEMKRERGRGEQSSGGARQRRGRRKDSSSSPLARARVAVPAPCLTPSVLPIRSPHPPSPSPSRLPREKALSIAEYGTEEREMRVATAGNTFPICGTALAWHGMDETICRLFSSLDTRSGQKPGSPLALHSPNYFN